MECVEWEERARASEPAAPVRARRVRGVALVGAGLVAVIALAVATVI